MKKYFLWLIIVLGIFAEDSGTFNDNFFEEDTQAVESKSTDEGFFAKDTNADISISDVAADLLKKSVSLTGDFNFKADYYDYTDKPPTGDFSSKISSDLFLDVRLTDGIKGYTSVKFSKASTDLTSDFLALNEMFLDFNIESKAYFRAGKQNLAWGRGYFFNPSDLINIGAKTIDDLYGNRTGNYGVKVTVPQGISKNYYAYIKMEDKKNAEDLDLALKYEFLAGKTEYSVAAVRLGENRNTVMSADFASSLKGAQTFGEFAFQKGEKVTHYDNGVDVGLDDTLVVQASLGYSKTFDKVGKDEENKSITLIQEFYYNGAGYAKSEKKEFASYNPYADGKLYLANFLTFNKFINKKTTLGINLLSGFSDSAHQISGSYKYQFNDDLSFGANLMGYLGTGSSAGGYTLPNYVLGVTADLSF